MLDLIECHEAIAMCRACMRQLNDPLLITLMAVSYVLRIWSRLHSIERLDCHGIIIGLSNLIVIIVMIINFLVFTMLMYNTFNCTV